MIGKGSVAAWLTADDVESILASGLGSLPIDHKHVLVIIPDGTRTAPIPLMFRLLYEQIGRRAARLDYLIALGTHPPMSSEALDRLVGVPASERTVRYPNVQIFNHRWDESEALRLVGTISSEEMEQLTGGLINGDVPVRLNRLITEYDHVIICGPVFPHEVAGFSGGYKYFVPGIGGPEILNATHWLGALVTNLRTIGVKDTPVRRVIHRAAEFVSTPVVYLAMVLQGDVLHGLYVGEPVEAWSAAADLSAKLNIITVPNPFKRVLSVPSMMYDDLWTAAKAMYKTEPVIADGGEVIIYAPQITEISYTHGKLIDQVGYHVRDYILKQWDRFGDVPGAILAHSTHVKGSGAYEAGLEVPRIRVTLATGIPEGRCRRVNLGYADYRIIDPKEWEHREAEGILVVPHAGEILYRVA